MTEKKGKNLVILNFMDRKYSVIGNTEKRLHDIKVQAGNIVDIPVILFHLFEEL